LSGSGYSLSASAVDELAASIQTANQEIQDTLSNGTLSNEEKQKAILEGTEPAELAAGYQNIALNAFGSLTKAVAKVLDKNVSLVNPTATQNAVKQVLGLPDVDLYNFNPLTELQEGDPTGKGLSIFSAQVQVQNTLVTLAKLISGATNGEYVEVGYQVVDAFNELIEEKKAANQTVNLDQQSTIESIISQASSAISSAIKSGAAQIIAEGNGLIENAANDPNLSLVKQLDAIAKIQVVVQGEIANDLEKVGEGGKTIASAISKNTGSALQTQINNTVANNPAFNPEEKTAEPFTPKNKAITFNVVEEEVTVKATEAYDAENGTVVVNANGTITYTPDSNFVGEDTIFYVAEDGAGKIVNGSVEVTTYTSYNVQKNNSEIYTGPVADKITTGNIDAYIKAGDGNNNVKIGDGENTVITRDGNDQITAQNGKDKIEAGDGKNVITTLQGDKNITSGSGDDQITTKNGDDYIDAGDGKNIINAGLGNNYITTGKGNDNILTADGDDLIRAGNGNNVIKAGDGENLIDAGDGNNNILTGKGNDQIGVGKGNNIIDAGVGNNLITTGYGNDKITTGDGNDIINSGGGNDIIKAGNGFNNISAGDGDDNITVGIKNDIINAGGGVNTINAGAGDDLIYGGLGQDKVNVGSGADIINLTLGEGITTVLDFSTAADKVQMFKNLEPDLTVTQGTGANSEHAFLKIENDVLAVFHNVQANGVNVEFI